MRVPGAGDRARLRLGYAGRLQPGEQISLLPEQVRIGRPRGVRNPAVHPPVVGLQAEGDGGNDEEK
jgi:hypothetical protein